MEKYKHKSNKRKINKILDLEENYINIANTKGVPRDSH